MAYTRTNWKNGSAGGTPITADRLNNIEQGIVSHETGKLDKPTGKTGQLVYNATSGAWEEASGGGGTSAPATVTYTGTAWPARPAVSGSVTWIDPTGAAPLPSGIKAGDLLLDYIATTTPTPTGELIPANQASMDEWWYSYGGTPTITAGKFTVKAAADKVGGSVDYTGGAAKLSATVTPDSGSTGTYNLQVVAHATSGAVYAWAGDALNPGKTDSAAAQTLILQAPADTTKVEFVVTGIDGQTATLTSASLKKVA